MAVLGLTQTAHAQREQGYLPPAPMTDARTSPLTGTALQPVVNLGQDLLGAGVLPRLRYVDAFAANPTGGLSQGVDNSGVVMFGADVDLGRVAGVPGATFHASFAQLYGHELSTDHIGSRTKVQSYYYPYKQFEMTELTFEQSLFGDRLNLLVGRANATGEFARDSIGCRFENVADCPFELTQLVAGFPGFPYVNWGGRVRVRPTTATYVKAGAYETNSIRNRNTGFDWGLNHSTGFVLPVEAGYETNFLTDSTPRQYKIGVWYNSADYTDPLLNTRGRSRVQFRGTPLIYAGGREGFYALADQMVWRHDGQSPGGVTAFANVAAPFDRAELYSLQAIGGVVWTGAFDARPADTIGVLGSYIRLSQKEDRYLNGLLAKAGSRSFVPRSGFVFEVNYGVRVVSGVVIQPSLQYLVSPDDISRTSATFAPKDALVVGLKLVVNANELLGLPDQLNRARGMRETGG